MSAQPNFFVKAGPLLLVLFIDGMGLGLVFPILNGLIFDPHSTFLANTNFTPLMHNMIYGSIIGIFMLCWFFGAAILGDLSDQIGRKKSLLICLVGAFLGYLVSAFSVSCHSLTLLILGRIIAGVTSGSQPIAQAAIIDLSVPEHKARNIGFILLSLSLGFIFGPLLGGLLSDNRIVSWFNFATPFYFAAMIAAINMGLLLWLLKETYVSRSTTFAINPYQAINIFISAFKNEKVRNLSILFFIFIFGWSNFYSFISVFLLKTYSFTPTDISLFMGVMGIGFGIGTGFLVNYLAKRISLRNCYIYNTLLSAIMIFFTLMIHHSLFSWIMVAPIACCAATAYTSILTLFSQQVDEKSQGWVMGITGSVMAFVFGVDGIIGALLVSWSAALPIFIAALFLFIAAIATYFLYKPVTE